MTTIRLISTLIAGIVGTISAVAFAPSVPSWANDHSSLDDGEFSFESYDGSGLSDWNQQIGSSWSDISSSYYEVDFQFASGTYYLGLYDWQTQPFSLSESLRELELTTHGRWRSD